MAIIPVVWSRAFLIKGRCNFHLISRRISVNVMEVSNQTGLPNLYASTMAINPC